MPVSAGIGYSGGGAFHWQTINLHLQETMKKPEWPKVIRVGNVTVKIHKRKTSAGNENFMVEYRDTDGKRKFPSAKTEEDAMALAQQKGRLLSNFGASVADTKPAEVAAYVRARELLEPFSVSVLQLAERGAQWLGQFKTLDGIGLALANPQAGAVANVVAKPLHDAKKDYVAELKADHKSELHIQNVETRLDRVLQPFKCDVATIDTPTLQKRLDAMNGGNTNYDNNRRVLSAFFGWCHRNSFHFENPAATPKKQLRMAGKTYLKIKDVEIGKKGIFSPEEMVKLMKAAAKDELPLLLFCGFAGLRTSEFARLKWSDVDFESGRLIVGEDEGKTTGSWRSLQMETNLCKALAAYRNCKGWVFNDRVGEDKKPLTFKQLFQKVCDLQRTIAERANVVWRKNALRHSYISYRLVLKHPVSNVADDAGNSPQMIHSHYKSLRFADGRFITEKEAKAWFELLPIQ